MKRPLHTYAGELMLFCAAMHTLVGIALYRDAWLTMARAGLVNTVHDSRENEAAFWFFVVSGFYLALGIVLRWARARGVRPPASIGVMLLGLAIVGLVLAPSFGWPFIAVAGALVLVGARSSHSP